VFVKMRNLLFASRNDPNPQPASTKEKVCLKSVL
jgi:hypothetical protein